MLGCVLPGYGAAQSGPGLISTSGTSFVLDNKTIQPVGYNAYRLASVPATERPNAYNCKSQEPEPTAIDAAALINQMSDLKAAGATLVRTWFFQSYWMGTNGPAVIEDDTWWYPFDRILDAAAKKGMRVIPVLVNDEWDCEPQAARKRITFYQESTQSSQNPLAYNRTLTGYRMSFESYAQHVVQHYWNGAHGSSATPQGVIRYQAIAWWQLVNEASADTAPLVDDPDTSIDEPAQGDGTCPSESAAYSALAAFTTAMTAVLKAADPDHLVSLGTTGSTGVCGTNNSTTHYQDLHGISTVDMCEVHDYGKASETLPNRVQVRATQCAALNKPLFIGEAGIEANVGSSSGAVTADSEKLRARYFDGKMAEQLSNKKLGAYVVWQKTAQDSAAPVDRDPYAVGPNDPTEKVTRSWSGRYGKILSDWEPDVVSPTPPTSSPSTTRGWTKAGTSLVLTPTAEQTNYTRFGSLMLTNYGANESTDIYLDRTAQGTGLDGAGVDAIPAGAVVTYRLYRPASASGATVTPWIEIGATRYAGIARSMNLEWNIVMLSVPGSYTGQAAGISRVGLTVRFPGGQRYCGSYEYDYRNCRYYCSGYSYATSGNQLYLDTVSFDQPAALEFASSSYAVREGQSVALTINRNRSSNGSVAAVCVKEPATTNGAQASDFQATSQTVAWADGDYLPKVCTLTANADSEYEGNEYVTVRLTSPTVGVVVGSPTTVKIENSESSPPPPPEDPDDPYCYKYYRDCYIQSAPDELQVIPPIVDGVISWPDIDVQPDTNVDTLLDKVGVDLEKDTILDGLNATPSRCQEP